jgi:hypothetical protein
MLLLPQFVEDGLVIRSFLNASLVFREKGGRLPAGQDAGKGQRNDDRQGADQYDSGFERSDQFQGFNSDISIDVTPPNTGFCWGKHVRLRRRSSGR